MDAQIIRENLPELDLDSAGGGMSLNSGREEDDDRGGMSVVSRGGKRSLGTVEGDVRSGCGEVGSGKLKGEEGFVLRR